MDNDKNTDFEDTLNAEESEFGTDTTSRARNRTVMLTPEITGEVRARLAQDMEQPVDPLQQIVGARTPGAPVAEPAHGSSYSPAGSNKAAAAEPMSSAPQPVALPPAAAISYANEGVVWSKESPIVGFLVSYDENPNGAVYELRSGRLIVTSEGPGTGNYLVVMDDTVSPMHAIMRMDAKGEIQVLDQLSEFGTHIRRSKNDEVEELSGDKSSLEHGDIISFGNRKFHVCVVARSEEE
ncbi:FHA domain-containing protein [Oligoflexia bacterium]|nr:FHA domain-containing protein [Oligoflexia bacterium]